MFLFHSVVVATILAIVHSLPAFGISCTKTLTPPTNSRGVNREDSNPHIPLYRLEISANHATNFSAEEPMTYRVQVTATNELLPFTDAKILVASKGPCGTGSLTFDHNHYFDVRQTGTMCPKLLLANQKLPMIELPSLTWKPPSCGCVQFRALVVSFDGEYYKDNDDADKGFLTQNDCVRHKGTPEVHLKALCHVLERYSAAEIISRASFLQRHLLEARWMDKHGLEMGLELRRSDNRLCCAKNSMADKVTCFNDSRRRRVDRFCEDGYPDIPFTSFRLKHMREREKKCCFLLGELRYTCFAESNELKRGPAVTLFDFSHDETDPVNDLAEFASPQDVDVLTSIGAVQFEKDDSREGNDDNDDNSDEDSGKEKADDDDDKDNEDEAEHTKPKSSNSNTNKLVNVEPTSSLSTTTRGSLESREMQKSNPADGRLTSREATSRSENPQTSSEKNKRTRKIQVSARGQSAERTDSRRASSREYREEARRSSSERAARRRSSAERKLPVLPGYSDPYFRGTGSSRDRDVLSSAERRARGRGSGQRRQDWTDVVDETNFEDQGGKSSDFHLHKLQKQMDRLRAKEQCCKAGMRVGRHVYGSISHVKKECEDSRHKYVGSANVPVWAKHCRLQYIDCCIEKAVSGPVITSSEFRDRQFMYADNVNGLSSAGGASLPQRHRGDWEDSPDLTGSRSLLDRQAGDAEGSNERQYPREFSSERETVQAYEQESEKRFQSMRNMGTIDKEDEDEDDYNGPKRFDEADNDDNYFDILERKEETLNRTSPRAAADDDDDKVDDLDDRDFLSITELEAAAQHKKHKTNHHHHHTEENQDQLDRTTDLTERKLPQYKATSSSKENPLLARSPGGRSVYSTNSRGSGGRSNNGKYISRESKQRNSMRRTSKTTSQERRQQARPHYSYGLPYKIVPSGKIGTEDSQEMAAAHGRKFVGALDSKEMVDAYRKGKPDLHGYVSDGRYQRKRWSY